MLRYGLPVAHIKGGGPNCKKCPKQGPENESRYRLSEKNRKAVEAFRKYDGQQWPDGWAEDEIWVRNCQIIREAERFYEQNRQYREEDRFALALEGIKQALR
jgi:hypothetical protein